PLLLGRRRRGGLGGLLLQCAVHPLVTTVVLRARRRNVPRFYAALQPPHRQIREAPSPCRAERRSVVGAYSQRQADLSENNLPRANVGSTIRTSTRYRLAASVSVSGSQRVPSAVRNQPLKSIDHSSLATVAGDTTSPCAIARWRRRRASTRPLRFRMSPIVEAAGQFTFGESRSNHALIFFDPKCGNRCRTAMTRSATQSDVACGQLAGAWLSSSNQRASPLSRRRFQT